MISSTFASTAHSSSSGVSTLRLFWYSAKSSWIASPAPRSISCDAITGFFASSVSRCSSAIITYECARNVRMHS